MAYVKKKGERGKRYWVRNTLCIGCTCFHCSDYEIRGATPSGSRSTGHSRSCCMNNAYRGCPPEAARAYAKAKEIERKSEGWSNA